MTTMTQVRIKRVYEAPMPDDGCRILIDRLWPRGMRMEALHFDIWAKDLAPSEALRRWYHADPQTRWPEFRRRYTEELRISGAPKKYIRDFRDADEVTLLFASKNAAENHALVLQEFLKHELAGVTAV